MIVIYQYDASTKKLTGTDVVADDYELKANETTIVCPDGLYEPSFDEQANAWKGITKEEWEAKHPQQPVKPSPTVEAMNALGQQLVQGKAESDKTNKNFEQQIEDLTQSVNMLGQMIAKTQGGTK
ncbi:hypothetical protein [Limosilactobacillus fastidiosus]|uniref:Uncharacterized protein n=1 Tax=Limosilactobacillus fastidiosus TaxID=2759855 RepID=A0ABR6E8W9_9LACO|nr:hypothetical protein [Limosilactobacillus fastidiosus]MBB1063652.1 hypothetical protein [Limosilactobacillus fastidiosus]MCD7084227.1 hypothetical protein [Limosilactobacillus fastidiosus]